MIQLQHHHHQVPVLGFLGVWSFGCIYVRCAIMDQVRKIRSTDKNH